MPMGSNFSDFGGMVLSEKIALAESGGRRKYTVSQLKEMIIDIQNDSILGIKNFCLCRKVLGFGQYIPIINNRFDKTKGDTLVFYYEPENLFTNRTNGVYHVWFTQDMILMDSSGRILMEKLEALQFNYQTQSPVMDIFGTNTISLDTEVPKGNYKFKIVVHDKLKDESVTSICDFKIV
jgi:hypothetical protein